MSFDPARDALVFEGRWDALAFQEMFLLAHPGQSLPRPRQADKGSAAGIFFTRGWNQAVERFAATAFSLPAPARVGLVIDRDPPDSNNPTAPTPETEVHLRLGKLGVSSVSVPQAGGIGPLATSRPNIDVGLWFMPDNASFGAFDQFLHQIVSPADPVFVWAGQATNDARAIGGTATLAQQPKSVLRAYLAWHNPPDVDYGKAVAAGRFDVTAPLAVNLMCWFDRMFP